MRLWRLVLDAGTDVWTFTVASTDPFVALELAKDVLPHGGGARATLEELEALYDAAPSRAGVVQAWRGGVDVTEVPVVTASPRRKAPTARRRTTSKTAPKKVKAAAPVAAGRSTRRAKRTG